MIRPSAIVAVLLICLLLIATPLVEAANPKDDKDKQVKTKIEKTADKKKEKDKQVEKAEEAIRSAEEAISEAEKKISNAEKAGLDVSEARDALRESKELLNDARKMLDNDPQRAASTARRAENMARMAASLVDRAAQKGETIEEQLRNYQELLNETGTIIKEARVAVEEALRIGGNVSEALQLIEEAERLLRNAESIHEERIEEAVRLATQARILAEKGLRVSEEIRAEIKNRLELRLKVKEAEETITRAQQAIDEAASKLSGTGLDEDSARPLREILRQAVELLEKSREKLLTSPEAAKALAEAAMRMAIRVTESVEEKLRNRFEVKAGHELNLSVSGKLSSLENEFRVENRLQLMAGLVNMSMERVLEKRMENGSVSIEIVKERIIVVGNKTLIEQVRVFERDGVIVEKKESIQMINETATASVLQLKQNEVNITRIDDAVSVDMLQRSDRVLRLRVSGPDGLGPRIMIIQLDSGAIGLGGEESLVVIVNGAEAKLAESVYDLLVGASEEPTYVLVKTASGYQVIVYFPHFSEYIVELRAIVMRILQFFDPQTAILATMAATMVIAVVMVLNMYRRYASRGRVLKLW